MPRPGALQEELDIDLAIRSITKEVGPELASALHSPGRPYLWEELVPDLVARLLEVLLTTGEPAPSDDRDIGAAVRRCARDWVPLQEVELCFQIVLACSFRRLWQMARPSACAELLRMSAQASAAMPIVLATIRRASSRRWGSAAPRS